MTQLILHLLGDYVFQSSWMAKRKTQCSLAAGVHALAYSLPFLLIASAHAWFWIAFTHFLIDRYRLARYVCYAKEFLSPSSSLVRGANGEIQLITWRHPWKECASTGYHKDEPPWMSVWLLIVADNTLHLLLNHLFIRFL